MQARASSAATAESGVAAGVEAEAEDEAELAGEAEPPISGPLIDSRGGIFGMGRWAVKKLQLWGGPQQDLASAGSGKGA